MGSPKIISFIFNTDNLETFNIKFDNSLARLKERGILNYKNEIVSELPSDIFGDNEKVSNIEHFWEEFKNTYPKKMVRGDYMIHLPNVKRNI